MLPLSCVPDHLNLFSPSFSQEELLALVAEQQATVMAAGLLDSKKEAATDDSAVGPSKPEPEPTHVEV